MVTAKAPRCLNKYIFATNKQKIFHIDPSISHSHIAYAFYGISEVDKYRIGVFGEFPVVVWIRISVAVTELVVLHSSFARITTVLIGDHLQLDSAGRLLSFLNSRIFLAALCFIKSTFREPVKKVWV